MDFVRDKSKEDAGRIIEPGSLVIVFLHHDELDHVYMKPNEILNNKWGCFHHNDLIGQRFGSVWKSKIDKGWVYALAPTPELWARALPHRTQIVHELDASTIIFMLGLKPGYNVCESGTGSGAMSTTILRTIAPTGHLYTFEFNQVRALAAIEEFKQNKLSDMVTVTHRDVCSKGLSNQEDENYGFAPLGPQSVDAVFLDLPEPWLAIPQANKILKYNKRLCSYSPCIEQTQKTCIALRANGFHSIKTIETRLKTYDVLKTSFPIPDFGDDNDDGDDKNNEKSSLSSSSTSSSALSSSLSDKKEAKRPRNEVTTDKQCLVAKVNATMRGHSAFLTFAERGFGSTPSTTTTTTDITAESNIPASDN
eukprot:CAMPEP_0114352970 /NCGR_PEP_ID=MMETSP0101-20121206/18326_1 /TAXON_ID=38822 ORGANISM="Pteridomonas danica, Strain PT" /NCGR_SAMPLE_ID=MMETSP0101 /ASSEMBLY_ACC=CAM_ASM_000211 /LENGTH=364 /DNA_ID=CAMNT_0001493599 /DNA_START=206 /DNA_END=1300 /DNA_ORIENTATION=+